MEFSKENIAAQAPDHIRNRDIVITYGHSRTVEAFLRKVCYLYSNFKLRHSWDDINIVSGGGVKTPIRGCNRRKRTQL